VTRLCIASCFLRLDGDVKTAWERVGAELASRGHELLLLTADDPHKVSVPALQVPFALRGFRNLMPTERGEPQPIDDRHRILVERDRVWMGASDYTAADAEAGLRACQRFFAELVGVVRPVAGLVWGNSLPQSVVLREILQNRGVPCFAVERGLLPGTFMLETCGGPGEAILHRHLAGTATKTAATRDMAAIAQYFAAPAIAKVPQVTHEDAEGARARLGLACKRVITFFGQHDAASGLVPRDADAQRRAPAFGSVSDALLALAEAVHELDDVVLIFKPHPKDSADYGVLSGGRKTRLVTDVNSQTIFALSDVIVAMTSTVQFESLWHQKPLLLLAESQLAGKGVAYEVRDRADLRRALSTALAGEDLDRRSLHAHRFLADIIDNELIGIHDEAPTRAHLADLAQFVVNLGERQPDGPGLEAAMERLTGGATGELEQRPDASKEQIAPSVEEQLPGGGMPSGVLIASAPIFVIGCPRSGTSVLSHSLARHSQTWLGPESNFIAPLLSDAERSYEMGTKRGPDHWLSGMKVSFEEYLRHIGIGLNALYTDRAEGKRWIDQTPEYTLSLPTIGAAFPEAVFVNMLRDGHEVVHSMVNSGFPVAWARDFRLACETWVRFVTSALDYQSDHPERVLNVLHHEMVAEPEAGFRRVLQFLRLPWEPVVTDMFARGDRINSSFKGADKTSWSNSWTEQQKAVFEEVCGPLQQRLGLSPPCTDLGKGDSRAARRDDGAPWCAGAAAGNSAGVRGSGAGLSDRGEAAPPLGVVLVCNYSEYEQRRATMSGEHRHRESEERRLMRSSARFSVPGHCYICGGPQAFRVDGGGSGDQGGNSAPNWRESMVCPTCGFNNRVRAAVHLFERTLRPSYTDRIYLCEQTTPLYRWFRGHYPNVVGSEYLGDRVPYGATSSNGLRNESLTRLTFEEESLRYILAFDVFEHVPDYHQAFSECLRCLAPGGGLFFTVPFAANSPVNIVRARMTVSGDVEHLLEPEYHFNPIQERGSLCFYHFGWEMLDELRTLGFDHVAALHYWSPELGYLGGEQRCFLARKAAQRPRFVGARALP